MKKRRNVWSADALLLILGGVCIVLAGLVAYLRPAPLYLGIAGGVILLVVLFVVIGLRRLRRGLRRLLGGGRAGKAAKDSGLSESSLPAVALHDGSISWYNEAFKKEFTGGEDVPLETMAAVIPSFSQAKSVLTEGQDIRFNKRRYTAYGSSLAGDESFFLCVFVEDTQLKFRAEEYLATRPSVLYFVIDTYDDVLKEMKESERSRIIGEIDAALEAYIGKANGFLRRVSSSRYAAIVEERHIFKMVENRFDILDTVRKVGGNDGIASLSIGVGRWGKSFRDCDDKAQQALELALGRGGDQAAMNAPDGFSFFGGLSRSVEKRTKVKSRVVARAIRELVEKSERVLVMGHKNSDMDSVGSAVGMLRFARICGKPAHIVIDRKTSLAESLLAALCDEGYEDYLLPPDDALELADQNTLLVVVDTHMKYLLESNDVYESVGNVVVVDHHRRMVGHIDNAVIFYHEPSASSASELVSELLQYAGDSLSDKPTPVEAEALLAGIMLDTRTFSLHVGVRTFEASAWLRKMGADTAAVKKMFSSSMDEYLYRGHLVSEAKVLHSCAIVVSDRVPSECEVVAPQAANDLLTIEGVKASFVAIKQGGQIRISARSMGEVNVQLVMEKLGGGGHLTMAGAQFKDVNLEDAENRLTGAIEEYWKENRQGAKKA